MKKDRLRRQKERDKRIAKRTPEEEAYYAKLEEERLKKIKESEKFRLYHNVQTDIIRRYTRDFITQDPFKSNKKYVAIVNSLDKEINRKNVCKYINELNYLMLVTETPNNYKKKNSFSFKTNPYKTVKHLCAHALADVYMSDKNYKKAIEYFNLAILDYPAQSHTGTTVNKDRLRTRIDIAKASFALHKKDDAYMYLIANIINGQDYGSSNKKLKKFLENENKSKFKAAIKTLKN